MSFKKRVRRMRTADPYNVLFCERERINGQDWDWVVVNGRWRAIVAVYHHWSRAFQFTAGIVPFSAYLGDRSGYRRMIMGFLEKSLPKKGPAGPSPAAKCPWLAKEMPAVHEYLTRTELEGGELRQTSTLSIFTEGGQFKCCLSERDAEVNLFASGAGLEECLSNLEERLTASTVDWRKKGGGVDRKSPKRS